MHYFVDKNLKNMESQYVDFGSLAHLKGSHVGLHVPTKFSEKVGSTSNLGIQIFMGNESSRSKP